MEKELPYRAYPLNWPFDQPRTPAQLRERGQFKGGQSDALKYLRLEIDRIVLGKKAARYTLNDFEFIVSTNMPVRRDGLPYAAKRNIEDPGVAVYFLRKGQWLCIACDKYDAIWKNMKAIAKTIESMRGIERWGTRELLDRAFTGFEALPEKSEAVSCWSILKVDSTATIDEIKTAHRREFRALHRLGASDEQLRTINEARNQALKAATASLNS